MQKSQHKVIRVIGAANGITVAVTEDGKVLKYSDLGHPTATKALKLEYELLRKIKSDHVIQPLGFHLGMTFRSFIFEIGF